MNAAEVVPSHIETNGMFQVLQFPTMSIRQTGETSKLHSEREIAPLDMRSRDVARVRPSILDAWDRPDYFASGPVPFRSRDIVAAVELNKLSVVYIPAQVLIDGRNVPTQAVRSEEHTSELSHRH